MDDAAAISLGTMMGVQYSLLPFGIAVGLGAARISDRRSSMRGSAGRADAAGVVKDPAAATDLMLAKCPECWQGSVPEAISAHPSARPLRGAINGGADSLATGQPARSVPVTQTPYFPTI